MAQPVQDVAREIKTELERFSVCPSKFQQCDYGYDDDDTSNTWWLIWQQPSRMDPDAAGICCRLGVQLSFDRQTLRVVNYLEDYLNFADTGVVEVARFKADSASEIAARLVSIDANLREDLTQHLAKDRRSKGASCLGM